MPHSTLRSACRAPASVALACLVVACDSGTGRGTAGASHGIASRTVVRGLTFPTGLPQPTALRAVRAFDNLTFDKPVLLAAPPDGSDRVVVVEQDGLVKIFANDPAVTAVAVLLDVRGQVHSAGEEGLLGLAFHPDFATNGLFYTYYSAAAPRRSVLSRWHVAPVTGVADPLSEQILLEVAQPYANHNAGSLAFGPDGKLYVALGDGGSGNDPERHAQDLGSLLGKILRLEPDGTVPVDNPFASTTGARGEIWAYGMRNPWRMSFDAATGELWVGDVGQNDIEEIDVIRRAADYGWPIYEGPRSNINPSAQPESAFEPPVTSYTHALGASVTGGHVYRGAAMPSLQGAYVYADFVSGRVWALVRSAGQVVSQAEVCGVANPASFGEDENRELYVCSFDGNVYRLEEQSSAPVPFPATLSATGLFRDVAALEPSPGVIEYGVNARLWSDGARKRRWIALPGTARIGFDPTEAWAFPVGTVLVKHFEIETAPGVVRRLETRVLLHHDTGWQGYTYKWNAAGTDALLLAGAVSEDIELALPGGGTRLQTWTYPSRVDCTTCHTAAAGRVLGVRTRQLNCAFAYPAGRDNQLSAWNHIGLFTADIGAAAGYQALVDPADPSRDLGARARSYLAANCSMCHRDGGPTPVDLDLRYGIALLATNTVGVAVTSAAPGSGSVFRITSGRKELSELWQRMTRRDGYGMPPLGSHVADAAGLGMIGAWIDAGPR